MAKQPTPELDPRFMATVRNLLGTPASQVPPPGKKKPAKRAKPKAAKKTRRKRG